jgi:hypothetical protein
MKRTIISIFLLTGVTGQAIANCATTPPATGLSTLLTGKTVCAIKNNGDKWQEEHHLNGDLLDFKKGPTDPVDPSKIVGNWSIIPATVASPEKVHYDYGSGGSYEYSLHPTGTADEYEFCQDNTLNIVGNLKTTSPNACGFNAP